MSAYITKRHSSKQGIHHGMREHVGVRVTKQSRFMGNIDAAENQSSIGNETVNVVAVTDTHVLKHHSLFL